ncbi:remorin-like isoform X3 [Solanum dulcamara]|uniref:remorin-like isoform X3 n=1 Tax=Solanum dulcamara TaxID=45834 RepID=UPI002486BDCB|nr:remorin-like isoform X3 [Solanum dulcamara]
MDMLKQMRVRFSGTGEEEKGGSSSSTRDRTIPPQKTQPFKGNTKKTPSWLHRQFIRTMSRDYDSSDSVDYPAAVAAAAFAVTSIEEKSEYDHRRTNSRGDKPSTKNKNKAEDIAKKPEKLSDEATKDPYKSVPIRSATFNPEPVKSAPSIKKKPTFGDSKPESEVVEKAKQAPSIKKTPTFGDSKSESEVVEKAKRAPSMKKTSTFPDKSIDIRTPKAPEVPVSAPAVQPTRQSLSQPDITKPLNTIKPPSGYSKADIWEKEEMEKIRERYKKLIKEIAEWETKKKKKAKRDLERVEAELDRRRAKARRHFNNEVGRIESIAGGAKEQADQHRKNEELKVIEKANKIRRTGKMPSTCSCF